MESDRKYEDFRWQYDKAMLSRWSCLSRIRQHCKGGTT